MITLELLLGIVVALGVAVIILIVLLIRANGRLNRFLIGKDAATLEDSFKNLEEEIKSFYTFRDDTKRRLTTTENQLQKSIRGVSVIRFNPFKGTSGSNQSFATALLTNEGDGVVLSSLYSRERVSIFAKPVEKGTSSYDLSEEERQAIETAQKASH